MEIDDFTVVPEGAVVSPLAELEIPWVVPIEHLSATSLSMYLRCPNQFRHRYILGLKKRPGEALALGSAVHEALKLNFEQKIASHVDLPIVELVDAYRDEIWPRVVAQTEESNDSEIEWDDEDHARTRGSAMIQAYQKEVAKRVQPIEVETRFELSGLAPVPVIGYIDTETDPLVIDYKTAKQKRKVVKPEWQLQGRLYSRAKHKPADFHVIAHTGCVTPLEEPGLTIAPTPLEVGALEQMISHTAERIERDYLTFGPDETWPTYGTINEMYNKSICGYCGYRDTCPASGDMT